MKIKTCKWCGKEFEARDRRMLYCSDECRRQAKNAKLCKTCKWCGKSFTAIHGSQKYCSVECRRNAKNTQARERQKLYKTYGERTDIIACAHAHGNCFECPYEDCMI